MYEEDLVVAGEANAAERALAEQALAEVAARFGTLPLYARVDLLTGTDGEPLLIELEVVEPALYLATAARRRRALRRGDPRELTAREPAQPGHPAS